MLVISPDSATHVQKYWEDHHLNFRAIADPEGHLLKILGQEVNWLRFGRMPAMLTVNKSGHIVHQHLGRTMKDLPNWESAMQALADEQPG